MGLVYSKLITYFNRTFFIITHPEFNKFKFIGYAVNYEKTIKDYQQKFSNGKCSKKMKDFIDEKRMSIDLIQFNKLKTTDFKTKESIRKIARDLIDEYDTKRNGMNDKHSYITLEEIINHLYNCYCDWNNPCKFCEYYMKKYKKNSSIIHKF